MRCWTRSSPMSRTTCDRSSTAKGLRSGSSSVSHAAGVRAERWLRHGSGARAQPGHGDRVSCVEWPRATWVNRRQRRVRLFTIGSPLEKIRFFWPWTLRAAQPSTHPDFQWVNFHDRADRVSGSLEEIRGVLELRNVRLKGGGGLLRSHVVYERSPEFLSVMTEALFGARPSLTWLVGRLKDRVLAWGENIRPFAAVQPPCIGLAFVVAHGR